MKNINITVLSLLFVLNLHAKCNTNAIVYKHESGFGISFGGSGGSTSFNDSETINIPLSIDDHQACFKKKSKFEIKTEEKTDSSKGKLVITPLVADFENVPNPSIKQYIFAEKSDKPLETNFYSMSFVCAGEIPLSVEASSDSYLQLAMQSSSANVTVSHTFATGAAADNLKNARINPKATVAYDFFADLYSKESNQPIDSICCGYKIPSVISSTSISSMSGVEREIARSFSSMAKNVPNGCSKDFSEKMKKYLIENHEENESLKPFKVSKKWFKDDLVLEWKN